MQQTMRAPQRAAPTPRTTPEPGFADLGLSAPVVRALAMRGIDQPFTRHIGEPIRHPAGVL